MISTPKTAVVLAGSANFADGKLEVVRPKVLLPIANRPMVSYLASVLEAAGVNRIAIVLDVNSAETASQVNSYFAGSSLHVGCVAQEKPYGTAGSVKQVESLVQGESFWVVNGDLFTDTDLNQMIAYHKEQELAASVGVLRIKETPWEMERVELDSRRRVKAIHRIHPAQNKRSMLRPAGLYLFGPEILDLIPRGKYFDLKEQLFPKLVEQGMQVGVWEIPGYCRTLSSVADFFTVNRDLLLGRAHFPNLDPQSMDPKGEADRHVPTIPPSAVILPPVVIAPSSQIGEGTTIIGPTIVGEDCKLGSEAVLDECIVLCGAQIGRGARLDRCILTEGARVEEGVSLRETIILRKTARAGDMTTFPGRHLPLRSSGLLQLSSPRSKMRGIYLFGKRIFDVLFSVAALAVLSPLMALIALAVRVDSPGGVIFRQRRSSIHGRQFTMYKFRTMVDNAEQLQHELLPNNQVDGPMFKILKDPRTTRLGAFLRVANLDELPQLWNVLRGDMSLIGPRPLSMDEMRYNPFWRDIRLSVRPGLTGLWQVEAHDKTSFADWIRYDLYYIHNMSPWLDFKILTRTFFNSVLPKQTEKSVVAGE